MIVADMLAIDAYYCVRLDSPLKEGPEACVGSNQECALRSGGYLLELQFQRRAGGRDIGFTNRAHRRCRFI